MKKCSFISCSIQISCSRLSGPPSGRGSKWLQKELQSVKYLGNICLCGWQTVSNINLLLLDIFFYLKKKSEFRNQEYEITGLSCKINEQMTRFWLKRNWNSTIVGVQIGKPGMNKTNKNTQNEKKMLKLVAEAETA